MASGYSHGPAYDSGFLKVSVLHELFYAQHGKQDGKPVIFLHGGPGGHTSLGSTIFFDPDIYRVVLLDQRGAGKSRPTAEIRENTSQNLVADIERLRTHLKIPKWHMVFGGSWGSALGLMYAQAHPDVVGSLVLRGIFTGSEEELQFSRGGAGAAMLFPEAYKAYLDLLPAEDRDSKRTIESYHKIFVQEDSELRKAAAKQFTHWEYMISKVNPESMDWSKLDDPEYNYTHSFLECHYCVNKFFIEEGELFRAESIEKIRHIPGAIVHGRFDLCCPPKTAWELHRQWPEAEFYMIPNAGHSATETGTRAKLIEICDKFGRLEAV